MKLLPLCKNEEVANQGISTFREFKCTIIGQDFSSIAIMRSTVFHFPDFRCSKVHNLSCSDCGTLIPSSKDPKILVGSKIDHKQPNSVK